MSNKITIALSAALLVAAAASAASAGTPRASVENVAAIAAVCSELPLSLQGGRCTDGPHCLYFDIGDRTVGPTFPTACHQTT